MDQSLAEQNEAERSELLGKFHEQIIVLNGQSPEEAFPDDIDPEYAKRVAFAMCEGLVTIDRWGVSARMVLGRLLLIASKNIQAYGFAHIKDYHDELKRRLGRAKQTLYDARNMYDYLKDYAQTELDECQIGNLVDTANEIRRHKGSLSKEQKDGLVRAAKLPKSEFKAEKVKLGVCAEGEETGGEPIVLTGLLADTIEYHRWMKDPAFVEWAGEVKDLNRILRAIQYCSTEFGNSAEAEIWKAVREYAATRDREQLVSNIAKAVEMFDAEHPPTETSE